MRIQFRRLKANNHQQKRKISREKEEGFWSLRRCSSEISTAKVFVFGDISSNWRLMQQCRRCNANGDPYLVLDHYEIELGQSRASMLGLPTCSDLERSRPGGGEALAMNWRKQAQIVDLLIDRRGNEPRSGHGKKKAKVD